MQLLPELPPSTTGQNHTARQYEGPRVSRALQMPQCPAQFHVCVLREAQAPQPPLPTYKIVDSSISYHKLPEAS
ncbi:hypothetical protein M406DRAFT_357356 [Cryphonectria parasitica EP155]|uniref:Uncharacterized protein n=1 Tax=Cryphonectria parasitica (strain ATCC 38755 / EP155) TaxID=660469 RepID=A0A9P5CLT3_CRYP1|nr:uncharacterized protein M406DRAFT_357356 [Cryphonectria parasitica EP155]KAF3762155.1 hypothetical protein M406DRAFT_357356 [Cryphonectria parasitica EP155]